MGTLCRGGLGGGWNLPIQTLPIPSENAGGATCRRRAASCTDISTLAPIQTLPIQTLPIQTLPIPLENAGGATCRRRAASCTDISTHRCPFKPCTFINLPGWGGWGGVVFMVFFKVFGWFLHEFVRKSRWVGGFVSVMPT